MSKRGSNMPRVVMRLLNAADEFLEMARTADDMLATQGRGYNKFRELENELTASIKAVEDLYA